MTDAPIICPIQHVQEDWIDYNGHMNMAFYHVVFDRGVDHVYDSLGIGAQYTRTQAGSVFTMEVHVNYLQEVALGDPLRVEWRLLDCDAKRLHFFEEMYHAEDGFLAATSEQMAMHVDMNTKRSSPLPDAAREQLDAMLTRHAQLDTPAQVGRVIRIRR